MSDLESASNKGPRDLEAIKSVATHDVEGKDDVKRMKTLGSVRHRHEHTGEIILIPTPSNDPNDPLNW
jgi:hypothetical protein